MADERSRLGRGLAALIGDVGEESKVAEPGRKPRRAPIENIHPNPRNPRRTFSEAELEELAASIRERGIIQPIVVRALRDRDDQFEIIAGERRWRAAQRVGLHDVPVVVIEASDAQALELAIIENIQRADLNAMEEAAGYLALMDTFGHTQEDLAKIVGKSRPHVANTLRLLKLSEPVRAMVAQGKISAGHAKALVGQPNALELAEEIVRRGLNVRQLEELTRQEGKPQRRQGSGPGPGQGSGQISGKGKDADTRALEKRVSDTLGLEVTVDDRGEAGGVLHIRYRDLEQLDDVLRRLERK